MERLGKIASEDTPVTLNTDAKIVLHIIPFGAFDLQKKYDLSSIDQNSSQLPPIYSSGWNHRYNFDGLCTFNRNNSYTQLFHNSIIEAVDTRLLQRGDNKKLIPSVAYEINLWEVLPKYLAVQKSLGVDTPLFIMLSLLGVSGYTMAVSRRIDPDELVPIDRNDLIIPEIMLEKFDCDPAEVMRPLFDAIWNAAGWPRSINYDETGKWVGQP